MKILQIFGAVVGLHVLALILIFAIPGCSSSNVPAPSPADTAVAAPPASSIGTSTTSAPAPTPMPTTTAAPQAGGFNPDAPATAASNSGATVRYTPTRPNTPAAGTLIAEPVMDVLPATTYTVKPGESLWTIASKHNMSAAQLAAANGLKTGAVIKPGQKLVLPGKPASPTAAATANPAAAQGRTAETVAVKSAATPGASTAPATSTAPAAPANGQLKHTVKSGETLGAIARIYGVKVSDIAMANHITDPAKVKAGTELVIPGWDPAAKTSKNGSAKAPAAATKSTPSAPPTINVENTPPSSAPVVPVISIEDTAPIVPAPKR